MAQAIEITDGLTGTVSFSRKLSDNNYGSSDAFFALQFPIEEGDTPETIAQKANTSYATCKAVVNAQLGLPVEDAVASALIQNAFGPETQGEIASVTPITSRAVDQGEHRWLNTPAAAVAEAVAPATGVGPNPPHGGDYRSWSKDQKAENTEWAKARFATHPNEFFDNRADKAAGKGNAKGPDVKHKSSGIGVWFS